MKQVAYILLATVLTAATSLLTGNALLQAAGAKLRRMEAVFLGFVLGAAMLAAVVFGLAELGLARRGVLVAAALALIAAAVWRRGHRLPEPSEPLPAGWSVAFWAGYAIFGLLYASVAMAPETSTDGTTHYLAQVAGWAKSFGPARTGGVELLFLFAFAIGKHSAAAMTELLFLLMLPLGLLACARRIGEPRAGVLGAMLAFASPILGRVGTIAAPDAALSAAGFALFLLVWRRLWLPASAVAALWAASLVPWLIREFEKPVLHLNGFYARLPLDLAAHGQRLNGLLGPVFLLAPLALLALRWPAGRGLVITGVALSSVCLGAMEARALVLGLPFLALALALVLVRWRGTGPAALAAHALMSWPALLALYADDGAWRLRGSEWRAALRLEPEQDYLARTMPSYRLGRLLEVMVPDGAQILTLSPFQRVYHSRAIVETTRLREILWAAILPERLPVARYELRFAPRASMRLTPAAFAGRGRWGINEIRAYRGELQVPITRIVAAANPGDAPFAADGNPATRWTSLRTWHGRMALELVAAAPVDRIVLECAADQGRPVALDGAPLAEYRADPPAELGRHAIAALRAAGIGWLLVNVEDRGAFELLGQAGGWGLQLRAIESGYIVLEVAAALH